LGLFVFEGGEGVGKTTQIEKLHNLLIRKNFAVLKTREPGGTPFAEKIRTIFKEKSDQPPLALTEIYLLTASRNEHVKTVLIPALKENKIILSDRFLDSTYVYQCVVGGIDKQLVDKISEPALNALLPDLTFVFYCDEKTALKRMKKEAERQLDRYDSSDVSLHSKILKGYKTVYEQKFSYPDGRIPKRIFIDASKNIEEIFLVITDAIREHCKLDI